MTESFILYALIFPIAITLHNIEEALWLPKWSKTTSKFHKPVEQSEFIFAVLIVTILAYIITFSFMLFPEVRLTRYLYFGYLGAMLLNAIVPHFVATIIMRKYAPGVITGLLINIPFFGILLVKAIQLSIITEMQLLISTVIVGGVILSLLPQLFKLGKKWTLLTIDE